MTYQHYTHSQLLVRFGKNLKKERLRRNLSQETLAVKASLSSRYVSTIERSGCNVTISCANRLSRVLDIKFSDLMDF
ncbi:MAG: helix-turn-helix transcriptional regulator [Planctomycetes bacterium]|nr:helix-turn-helix transcriptional regulator [Planctomycetota bacterium]